MAVLGRISEDSQRRLCAWENFQQEPYLPRFDSIQQQNLDQLIHHQLDDFKKKAFLSHDEIAHEQFESLRQIVTHAFNAVPFYHEKYREAGFEPGDLKSIEDFFELPLVAKEELLAAYPSTIVNGDSRLGNNFMTCSSGTTGKLLKIHVDEHAAIWHLFGLIRQYWLQSQFEIQREDKAVWIYSAPPFAGLFGGGYEHGFISSLMDVREIIRNLRNFKPSIIWCSSSILASLIRSEFWGDWGLKLIVIHSEQTTREQRLSWSKQLGTPVLDEYSSEEASRIGIELPDRRYYCVEDSVYVECLGIDSDYLAIDQVHGRAVITNLMNKTMPFIRYIQGDLISKPYYAETPFEHGKFGKINWRTFDDLGGRLTDSFIRPDDTVIPPGVILDILYRSASDYWNFVAGFRVVQTAYASVRLDVVPDAVADGTKRLEGFLEQAEKMLSAAFGCPIELSFKVHESLPVARRAFRPDDIFVDAVSSSPLYYRIKDQSMISREILI